ncbi:hypothetical protein M8332_06270 [Fructilactobacillus ixorae]|uniref:Uncharacterized protein n=1 Tax=Fructilactobacillus ixorae TaxID=1750535 RepID=A0ABY5C4A9_9LACO|nr:hypothetical protein [Fructilactobacillus ixorae]USS93197.1 hypothetical protein M8332_06270 [Fructilactobacillus ixorae]
MAKLLGKKQLGLRMFPQIMEIKLIGMILTIPKKMLRLDIIMQLVSI